MKGKYNFLFFTILISFFKIVNVNAECSYNERNTLLKSTKNVDIIYEIKTVKETQELLDPVTLETKSYEIEKDSIVFTVTNINSDFYIIVKNNKDYEEFYITNESSKDGIYIFETDNLSDIIKYKFEFHATSDNCSGYLINTKNITKPKLNTMSLSGICNHKKLVDNEYCKKYITRDFDLNSGQILDKLNNIINDTDKDDKEDSKGEIIVNFIRNYWYVFVIFLSIVLITGMIIFVKRRKNRL